MLGMSLWVVLILSLQLFLYPYGEFLFIFNLIASALSCRKTKPELGERPARRDSFFTINFRGDACTRSLERKKIGLTDTINFNNKFEALIFNSMKIKITEEEATQNYRERGGGRMGPRLSLPRHRILCHPPHVRPSMAALSGAPLGVAL